MQDYDVVIVGGGPVGGLVAQKISTEGYQVAIFEEHKKIGKPLKCAGLITSKVFDFLEFSKNSVLQNEVTGANIHSPSGYILNIGGDKVHALVIDRTLFDEKIINHAIKQGTDVFLENKIISIKKSNKKIELKTKLNSDVKCNLIIGADGSNSKVRKWANLPQPSEILKGIGAEITNVDLDPNFIEIFVGPKIAPGFFAWIIPTNKKGTHARIGLCSRQNSNFSPKHYLSNLLKNKNIQHLIKDSNIKNIVGGTISLGYLKKSFESNLMIVGDAAAQVKPTSGGGIYTGLLCANHCSDVAIKALKKGNFSSNFLKQYHKQWRADIGRELYLGMKFRNIFKNFSDEQFDKYVKKFQNQKITEIISEYGDIDYPSKLVKPLVKNAPTLLKLLPIILKNKKNYFPGGVSL